MKITFTKIKKSRDDLTSKSKETDQITSEENVHNREFEVYFNNDNSSFNKETNRFFAERELSGNYMYSITNTDPKK